MSNEYGIVGESVYLLEQSLKFEFLAGKLPTGYSISERFDVDTLGWP